MIMQHQKTLLLSSLEKKRILYSGFFYKKLSLLFSSQLRIVKVLLKAGSPESAFLVSVETSKAELERILKECYSYVYKDVNVAIDQEVDRIIHITANRICNSSKRMLIRGDDPSSLYSPSRLLRIVKTELNCALNSARHNAAVRSGLLHKQWVSSVQESTVKRHGKVSNSSIPISERFQNGMLYPGDVFGPIKEVINCSCCCIYF